MVTESNRLLYIFMNGKRVGTLEKPLNGNLTFSYTSDWLNEKKTRPISLSLPLIDRPHTGSHVFNFFDNLLPDNMQIRKRIQAKFHIASNHPFDLLAKIGHDCVGAIQILETEELSFSKTITKQPLTDKQIADILRGYRTHPLGMSDNFNEFRISIAGAQEKTAFLYHNDQWCVPLGTTPTTHIFKLPIGRLPEQGLDLSDSCENEWLCHKIIKAFGLRVAPCEIKEFDAQKALVVTRFDRQFSSDASWIMRLPQEDMCQALGIASHLKYQADGGPGIQAIMKILMGAIQPELDCDSFFKAQIVFWLLCAIDGHAKNFSVFLEPEGKYTLTPLYDIISAFPLINNHALQARKVKMAMALKGKNSHYKWFEGQRSHFLETAKLCRYSTTQAAQLLDSILEQVETVIQQVESDLPTTFPEYIASPIFLGMQKMKIRLEKKM